MHTHIADTKSFSLKNNISLLSESEAKEIMHPIVQDNANEI